MMNINKILIRLLFGLCFLQLFCNATAQNISNVYSIQDGEKIKIFYTVDKAASIAVFCSTDGGKTFGNALQKVSGDVGLVSAGKNTIVWDVLAECDKLHSENVVFEVRGTLKVNYTYTVNGVAFEVIYVEGGSFDMASDYKVTLNDYFIGKFEVTQELWRAVMGSDPSFFKGNYLPVEQVSWNDAQEFISKLNQKTGQRFRLPTEAEWEYAARGGTKSRSYEYSGSNTLSDVGWNWNNSGDKITYGDWDEYEQVLNNNCRTHPVGQKTPNELGIYDMSGNVWEWCQDWYDNYSSGSQTNPTGPSSGSGRVLRGGSWSNDARRCRVSHRCSSAPDLRGDYFGFRVVLLP